jgi:hypothetical protein
MNGKLIRSADSMAREHTETAIETIANVMNDWAAEDRDRLAAANAILDRGHGKPLAAVIEIPASKALQQRLASMTDDELMARIQSTELPRLAKSVPAGTIIDVDPEIDPLLL